MPSTARFGVVLLPESLAEFGPLCREVDEHGFDWLGVADSQSVFREGPSAALAPSAARLTWLARARQNFRIARLASGSARQAEYASRAAIGRRLAAFSSL